MNPPPDSNVIIEMHALGGQVKVTAIDEKTGVEAVIIAPIGLSKQAMQQQALNKLQYLLSKKYPK